MKIAALISIAAAELPVRDVQSLFSKIIGNDIAKSRTSETNKQQVLNQMLSFYLQISGMVLLQLESYSMVHYLTCL